MTSQPVAPLDSTFSLYLDLVRFISAALVVLIHFAHPALVSRATRLAIPDLGREAVVLFFVLSGFVIAYTFSYKHQSARDYIVARSARIYSVALPIVLLSFPLAALAMQFTAFEPPSWYQLEKAYLYIPFHLAFGGEIWTLSETPPMLPPYWSLNYEVWYYILFGAVVYLHGRRRVLACAALLLLVGPRLWLLLPVWWSGVWLYRWQARTHMDVGLARAGWLASLLLLWLYCYCDTEPALRALAKAHWPFNSLRLGSSERYLADYLVCLMVLLNLGCARYCKFGALHRFTVPIRALSAYTFTLYLLHWMVRDVWIAFYRPVPDSATDLAMLVLAIALATYLVGFVTEKQKARWTIAFERLVAAVGGSIEKLRGKPLP